MRNNFIKIKRLVLLFSVTLCCFLANGQTTYYVSNSGNDGWNGTSTSTPFKTLKKAHDAMTLSGIIPYNIVLMDNGGDIQIAPSNASGFIWTRSGTVNNPINVYSEECRAVVTRTYDNLDYIIKLRNVAYVNFKNIFFKNVSLGAFYIDNSDYCLIDYCQFGGINRVTPTIGGHAVIWIGGIDSTGQKSTGNKISNNLFSNIYLNDNNGAKSKTHAIYLSHYSEYNEIFNNTIFDPTSYAVHFYHDHFNNNQCSYNIVTQNLVEGVGSRAFALSHESTEIASTITNNYITNNYVFDDDNTTYVNFASDIPASNNPNTNGEESVANFGSNYYYPSDPYWLGYDPSQITNKLAAGDFNGDGYSDDIAGIYDNGNGTVNVHVWKTDPDSKKAFIYSGGTGWWYGSSYTGSNVTGRVVAGNYDPASGASDLAAFYDYGSNVTQIHVWRPNSGGTAFQSPAVWWNTSGYNATKITNRVVTGSYGGGASHDIAAFYDNGNGTGNLHVWLSNGSNAFTYQYGAGWWSTPAGYDVTKLTGRVVSGDFNNDGKSDIAGFYDNGSGNVSLQVWIGTGSGFTFQGTTGWWSVTNGSYDVTKITSRVVCSDYNADGKSDIVAYFDAGSGTTKMHAWLSTGSAFTFQGTTGWWNATGYDANKLTGRVVAGDFDRNSTETEITGFYDYDYLCGSLRTNVWQQSGSAFNYLNNSLGYPWLTSFVYEKSAPAGTEVQIDADAENQLVVYPNPSNGMVNILVKNTNEDLVGVEVYNLLGEKVMQQIGASGNIEVDLSNQTKGVYILNVLCNGEKSQHKVILE